MTKPSLSSEWSTILPAIALINELDTKRFTINPIDAPNFVTEIYELRSARHTLAPAAEQCISMLEVSLRAAPGVPSSG